MLDLCEEVGIGFLAYAPLGRGMLTGNYRRTDAFEEGDFRRTVYPRLAGENFERNLSLVERVEEIAREKGVTPGQLALAWLLAQRPSIVPIPGTKRVRYLEENAAATEIELTREDLERLDEAVPRGAVAGARYPEGRSPDWVSPPLPADGLGRTAASRSS